MTFYTGGSERVRIDTSGNVLIGRTTQIGTEKLSVQGATLGGTAGNTSYSMTLYTPDVSNTTRLNFFDYRLANGTSHTTSQNRIQRRVDSTEMGYLGFDSSYTRIGWGTTDALYLNDSNNVGIGSLPVSNVRLAVGAGNRIANSFGNLYVYTTDTATTNFGGQITVGGSYSGTTNAPFAGFAGRWEGTGLQGYAQFNVLDPSGNLTERMRISSDGTVGIGTSSFIYGAKLYVSSAGSAQSSIFVVNPGIGSGQVGVAAASSNFKIYNTYSTGTLAGGAGIDIDQNGNVGIGTASPGTKLDVSGSIRASASVTVGNGGGTYQAGSIYSDANWGMIFRAAQASPAQAQFKWANSADSELMRISSAGNVGIGITPSTKLHVYGAGTTSTAYTNGDATGPTLYLQDSGSASGNGGQLLFGAFQGIFAGIKGGIVNGTGPAGVLIFQTRSTSGNVIEQARIGYQGGFAVGTTAEPGAGAILATGNITAYYSDARLKDFKGKIGDALYKVSQLNGYYYTENEKAEEFGYNNKELQVGVSAQEVKAILPEVIAPAPFDMDAENKSKSGEDYMTVRYEKLVPLLIEAIKELTAKVEALEGKK